MDGFIRLIKRAVFVAGICFIGLMGLVQAAPPKNWPEGWSKITSLHEASVHSRRLALLQDEDVFHFAWVNGTFKWELDVLYAVVRDGELTEVKKVSRAPGNYSRPFLARTSEGIHLAWQEVTDHEYKIHHALISGEQIHRQTLVTSSRPLKDLTLAAGQDKVHLFWSDQRKASFQIYHLSLNRQGQIDIGEHAVTSTATTSSLPAAVVNDEGTIHLFWAEVVAPQEILYYLQLDAKGKRLTAGRELGKIDALQGQRIMPLIDKSGNLHVFWPAFVSVAKQRTVLSHGVFRAGKFISEILTPQGVKVAEPDAVRVENGAIHLVWNDAPAGVPQVFYGIYPQSGDGDGFTGIRLDVDKSASLHPRLGTGPEGHLYVFWFESGEEGRYQIATMNTKNPMKDPFWVRLGLDRDEPLAHLVFAMIGNIFMSIFAMVVNALLVGVGVLLVMSLKWAGVVPDFNRQRWIWVVVLASFLWMLQSTGLFFFAPAAYGVAVDVLAFCLATLAVLAVVYMTKINWNDALPRIGVVVMWMLWYLFFLRVPESLFMQ